MNLDSIFDRLLAEISDHIAKHVALGGVTDWNHYGSGKNLSWALITASAVGIGSSGARIVVDNAINTPHYERGKDAVMLFGPERYELTENYYSTVFHELGHWTGKATRLDRPASPVPEKFEFAMEEMVAEFTAAFICAALNISNDDLIENQAIYIAAHYVYGSCTDDDLTLAITQAKEAAAFLLNKAEWPLQIAA